MKILLRPLLFALGWTCVGLGALGLFLPLLPTTPFLLLAAWCFDHSSPKLHGWLLRQPVLGPLLADWRAHGVIRPRAKWLSTLLLLAFAAVPVVQGSAPTWAIYSMAAVVVSVLAFLWTRPSRPPGEVSSSLDAADGDSSAELERAASCPALVPTPAAKSTAATKTTPPARPVERGTAL